MLWILACVLFTVVAVVAPRFIRFVDENVDSRIKEQSKYQASLRTQNMVRWTIRGVCGFLVLFCFASTSYLKVPDNKTGHLFKVYGWNGLTDGRIVAFNGEKGPQITVVPPGFHVWPGVRVIYNSEYLDILEVPEGKYAYMMARDGAPMRDGQTYADPFPQEEFVKMVSDGRHFLEKGGQKGPQTSVLPPGKYRINRYLWETSFDEATVVDKGFVAVIKSNVHSSVNIGNLLAEKPAKSVMPSEMKHGAGSLEVPLVRVGCIGIWDEALNPGTYYLNKKAYIVTPVDTRVQTWEYKGGYIKRSISLQVDQKGNLTQTEVKVEVPIPEGADPAVMVKIEGWDVPQELRVLAQVTPENAPFVVASVGGIKEVEHNILTPSVRSVVRTVCGGSVKIPTRDKDGQEDGKHDYRPTQVMDLIEHRELLEGTIRASIHPEGMKAGVDIKEIRFGEPAIPPELLVARLREQLASQLLKAYEQERLAQDQRVESEKSRATADQQPKLVEAQIEVQRSEQTKQARENEGLGEKAKLMAIAEGQKAQAQVLGEEKVVSLRKFELTIDTLFKFANEHPQVLQAAFENAHKFVPQRITTVGGNGGGGNTVINAAAILGDMLNQDQDEKVMPKVPAGKPTSSQ